VEIRVLDAGEFDASRDVRSRSFGPIPDDEWAQTRRFAGASIEAGRQYGGYEDGRLVATARIHDLRQWWQGRSVSMGGIGGVAVAPEARGRGVGRELMRDVLERCAALGHPLSMLYPATAQLYRSLGWEHAGAMHQAGFSTEALRAVVTGAPAGLRRAGPADAAEVAEVIRRVHRDAGNCGPIDWGDDMWRFFLDENDDDYVYLAEDGVLDYRWGTGNTSLVVETLLAGSQETLHALWAIIGSGSSTAASIEVCLSPHDPVFWLTKERLDGNVHLTSWMLRVVDAPAAIEARGFPQGVTAEVALEIHDPDLPANSGTWRLAVKDGEGRLEPAAGARNPVRLGARGLSALYGGVPTSTLRGAGLLEGHASVLDAIFGATAFALDEF
jgi:predicted acetyltransferase